MRRVEGKMQDLGNFRENCRGTAFLAARWAFAKALSLEIVPPGALLLAPGAASG